MIVDGDNYQKKSYIVGNDKKVIPDMMRFIFLLFFSFLFFAGAAQLPTNMYWHQLSTSNGLSDNSVNQVFKDSEGYVWLGATTMLFRFDGNRVERYMADLENTTSILGQNIQGEIIEDKNGDLWITTYQAINHYRRKTNDFKPYTINDDDGKYIAGFYTCGQGVDKIWLMHSEKIYTFDLVTERFLLIDSLKRKYNRGIYFNEGDKSYLLAYSFRGRNSVLTQYNRDGKRVNRYKKRMVSEDKIEVRKMLPISANEIWAATSKGLYLMDIPNDKEIVFKTYEGHHTGGVVDVNIFNEDYLLVTGVDNHLYLFDRRMQKFVNKIKVNNTLVPKWTSIDDGGNIWIASKNSGMFYAHPDKVKFENSFKDNYIRSFVEVAKDSIMVFTDAGVFLLNDLELNETQVEAYDTANGNALICYTNKDAKDRVWSNYNSKNGYYDLKTKELKLKNPKEVFLYGLPLKDGRIFFSKMIEPGIFQYNEETETIEENPLPNSTEIASATFLYESRRGFLIVCENLNTISFYNPNNFNKIHSFQFSGNITDLYESPDDSLLWIASSSGLFTYSFVDSKVNELSKVSEVCGSVIHGILPHNDYLWVSTNNGICQIDRRDKKVVSYKEPDGVSGKAFSRYGHLQLSDGRMLFGGEEGVVMFSPEKIKSTIPLALPKITNIYINGQDTFALKCKNTNGTNYNEIEHLELDYTENKVGFDLAALEYSHPEGNRLRFRLLPEEKEWSEVENGSDCQFNNLKYIKHTFELQAANSDGKWNPNTKRLILNIHPPFWETWPFRILAFFLLVGAISLFFYWRYQNKQRLQQLKYEGQIALEQQRLQIARDMHDDLGSQLSAMGIKTAMLEYKFQDPAWKEEMAKLTAEAQNISTAIRETIWTVNAKNDTLDKLVDYLVKYANTLFDDLPVFHRFHIPEMLPEIVVSGEVRRMAFLAYKEILNNIIKHAKAKKVSIEISIIENQIIEIIVTDDGIGFNYEEAIKQDGNGLMNMNFRMEKINGTCTFLSVEKGTKVSLKFDLTYRRVR